MHRYYMYIYMYIYTIIIYVYIYTCIYIHIYIKFTEASHHNTLNITQNRWCSTISIFWQQAAFVRNVQIKNILIYFNIYIYICIYVYIHTHIYIFRINSIVDPDIPMYIVMLYIMNFKKQISQ